LGAVDGSGIAQPGRDADVVGWQADGVMTSVVSHGQIAALADMSDSPTVAVLTQSVGARWSRRSLVRVMIMSPTLAWFPSAKRTSRPAG
jgi:hypothetical protein